MGQVLIPFERTVCSCEGCVACCRRQPGFLVPGDVERIVKFTGKDPKEILADSQGGLLQEQDARRLTYRVRTIVPQSDKTGRCIFLTPDDKCSIHPVSPFGCAYTDTHMSAKKGYERSMWGMAEVRDSEEYQALRKTLPLAKSYKPNTWKHRAV